MGNKSKRNKAKKHSQKAHTGPAKASSATPPSTPPSEAKHWHRDHRPEPAKASSAAPTSEADVASASTDASTSVKPNKEPVIAAAPEKDTPPNEQGAPSGDDKGASQSAPDGVPDGAPDGAPPGAPPGDDVVPFSGSHDPTGGESSYILTSWLFFRVLGLVYVCAFGLTWLQIIGLIGEGGILPLKTHVETMLRASHPESAWWHPMLFWYSQSDTFIYLICGGGVAVSLLLFVGIAPLVSAICAWALYLSLVHGGQVFFYFQWDTLLLEVGFLAIFLAGWQWWPRLKRAQEPPIVVIWMFRLLLFRLMFFSGLVKLLSGDPAWRDLSAMQYHYWTQPLPSWISWYVHQLPALFHSASVVAMLAIELLLPFAILATRTPRAIAGLAMIALQVGIGLTGNYGFFNLLSAALCLFLLDDAMVRQLIPDAWSRKFPSTLEPPLPPQWERITRYAILGTVLPCLLLLGIYKESMRFQRYAQPGAAPSGWYQKINHTIATPFKAALRASALRKRSKTFRKWFYRVNAWKIVNRYGLFATMTKTRPEIIIEGSLDGGKSWKPYSFRWKMGDLKRAPAFAGPHMPRLDWQMWFAALRSQPPTWLRLFAKRLREGSPHVLGLLQDNPFPKTPPKMIRGVLFHYTFASPRLKSHNGTWWERKFIRSFDL